MNGLIMAGLKIEPMGDCAARVEMGDSISEHINDRVHQLCALLESRPISGILDIVPAYTTITVHYDMLACDYRAVENWIHSVVGLSSSETNLHNPKIIDIPTVYGGDHGPDLESVAGYAGLALDEVISIHASRIYRVYMMGFMPGFPYLGGLDDRIAAPRLETPRKKVPAGSVGIAGNQTGIYPLESPGGWRLIGWTPVRLFDPRNEQPFLLSPGDRLRFVPVTESELSRGD